MADNIAVTPGAGAVLATDDIAGVHYPITKLAYGPLDSATAITDTTGLPVQPETGSSWTIQGVQDNSTSGTITSATSVVGPLSVVQRNVITISIQGTYAGVTFIVECSDDGGTSWFPLQCIDNASGQAANTFTPGTNASASYDSAVGGYTHMRVRATAWTSGTATVTLTAQAFAYDPVVAAISQPLDVDVSLSSVAANSTDVLSIDARGFRSAMLQITGTFTATATFQGSVDGTTWYTIFAYNVNSGAVVTTVTAVGIYAIPVKTRFIRLRTTSYTSGTIAGVARLSSQDLSSSGMNQSIAGSVTPLASTNLIGDVGIQYRTSTTGAALYSSILSPATPAGASIKASAGRLIGWQLVNTSAALRSVKFYNATSVTMGTTSAVFEVDLPAGGRSEINLPGGIAFSTGIMWAVTGGKGLTDNTTGVAANDVSGCAFYV